MEPSPVLSGMSAPIPSLFGELVREFKVVEGKGFL
jgi:hypothetical protein